MKTLYRALNEYDIETLKYKDGLFSKDIIEKQTDDTIDVIAYVNGIQNINSIPKEQMKKLKSELIEFSTVGMKINAKNKLRKINFPTKENLNDHDSFKNVMETIYALYKILPTATAHVNNGSTSGFNSEWISFSSSLNGVRKYYVNQDINKIAVIHRESFEYFDTNFTKDLLNMYRNLLQFSQTFEDCDDLFKKLYYEVTGDYFLTNYTNFVNFFKNISKGLKSGTNNIGSLYDTYKDITSLSLDLSDDVYMDFIKDLIIRKDGKVTDMNCSARNYAKSSNEVIYYSHVSQEKIVAVINPLQVDLLYNCNNFDIYRQFFRISLSEKFNNKNIELLKTYATSDIENFVIENHYVKNKSINAITNNDTDKNKLIIAKKKLLYELLKDKLHFLTSINDVEQIEVPEDKIYTK